MTDANYFHYSVSLKKIQKYATEVQYWVNFSQTLHYSGVLLLYTQLISS